MPLMRRQHAAQNIPCFEKHIHHIGAQGKLPLADAIQHIFKHVRGFRQISKAKGARTPLD